MRATIVFLYASCLITLCLSSQVRGQTAAAAPENICVANGDVDCSGILSINDLTLVQDYFLISGTQPPCPEQMDVTGDCIVTWEDYELLLDCLTGSVPCPSVETCCEPLLNSTCCIGQTGDANGSGDEAGSSIGDVAVIIDFLFISGDPSVIPCVAEADVNQSGGCTPTYDDITIGDVTAWIDATMICVWGCGLPPCLDCE